MNHPTHEDWMSFLYGENSPELHAELEAHLGSCAECASRVESWRNSTRALDGWKLPETRRVAKAHGPWKWAAAAALVLGVGLALGRFAFPIAPDMRAIRVALASEFDQKLASTRAEMMADARQQQDAVASRLLAEYAREQEEQRSSDQRAFVTALRQLDAKYTASLAVLRKELETVAVNTQDGFLETEQRLGQLASSAPPANLPPR